MKALGAVMGLKVKHRQRDLRHDHPGHRGRQVRRRRLLLHGHEGTPEDGRLRRLLHGGGPPSMRRPSATPASASSPTRAARRCRSRRGPPSRKKRPRRAGPARKKARRPSRCSSTRPERGQPRDRERTRGTRDGRLARRRLPGQAVERPVQADRETYGQAPYGIALPKGSGLTTPMLAALKVLIADGTYTKILTKWGVQWVRSRPPRSTGPELSRLPVSSPEVTRRDRPARRHKGRPGPAPGALAGGGDHRGDRSRRGDPLDRDEPALRMERRRGISVRPPDPPRRAS